MKHGFMLIELIIATLIASMIGSLLLTALSQGVRFQKTIDNMVDISLKVATIEHQLEKDFIGAFLPVQAQIKESQDEGDSSKTGVKTKDASQNESAPDGNANGEKDKDAKVAKPAEKPLEKSFYSQNKNGQLSFVTFITNNPLNVFVGNNVGTVKSKLARVKYTLKRDDEYNKNGDSFTLFRQESSELNLSAFENTRSYELIGGIKECTVVYTARIKKQEAAQENSSSKTKNDPSNKTKDKKQEQEKIEYEYKELSEWNSDQQEAENDNKADEKNKLPRLPYRVDIKLVLWDKNHEHWQDFALSFVIPIDVVTKDSDNDDDDVNSKASSSGSKQEVKADAGPIEKQAFDQDNFYNFLSEKVNNITTLLHKM